MKIELDHFRIPLPSEIIPPADTVRLLDAEAAFKKLGVQVHLETGETGYKIVVDDEELEVSGEKELGRLVFGVPDNVLDTYGKFMAKPHHSRNTSPSLSDTAHLLWAILYLKD